MSTTDAQHEHHPAQAHHFESMQQQTETGKLGMWIFLATEILMFGGLFCAYAIYRGNHPEMFMYAHRFLDWKLGTLNTIILLTSSMTMAWAVRAAVLGQQKVLVLMLCLTLGGGVGFLIVKSIEYGSKFHSQLYPGPWNIYYPAERTKKDLDLKTELSALEKARKYTIRNTDNYYLGKYGVYDPVPEKYQHPRYNYHAHPKGMTEADWHEVIAAHAGHGDPPEASAPNSSGEEKASETASEQAGTMPANQLEPVASGPRGVKLDALDAAGTESRGHHVWTYESLPAGEKERVHLFYQIYYCATGLHGLHVLIGMGLIAWILVRASKGAFDKTYNAPVEIVGLYWHLVDLIWIFLFPLLYLIH